MPISREELGKLKLVTKEDDERLIKEGKKEYLKQYNEKNKEKISKSVRQYYDEHGERIREYSRRYYEENKEVMKANTKQNYKENREEKLEYSKKYYIENKEVVDEYGRKYRLEHNKEICEHVKKWQMENPEKVRSAQGRSRVKRRNLGYEEILPPQWGCDMHHIDDTHVIPIPTVVHEKFSGRSTEEHIRLVDEWMREVRPDLWLIVQTREAFEDVFRETIERCRH